METGYRRDSMGQPIPRHIISRFVCTYNGEEVFRAEFFPAIAANPFLSFFTVATETGEVRFQWTDDQGNTQTETVRITVV
jgi:sulfur-oxidizing protein SoxZ